MLRRRFQASHPKNIDLGCGPKTKPGFTGVDLKDCGQDIVWDIRNGLPFADNSIENVFSSHFVEHLTRPDICELINELLRVCKIGAHISICCPHSSSVEADYPDHHSYWDERRVVGIVKGLSQLPFGNVKRLKIIHNEHDSFELRFILEVIL